MSTYLRGSRIGASAKEPTWQCSRPGLIPRWGRAPGEGNGDPLHPIFLSGESHGQRSLAGYVWSIGWQSWT